MKKKKSRRALCLVFFLGLTVLSVVLSATLYGRTLRSGNPATAQKKTEEGTHKATERTGAESSKMYQAAEDSMRHAEAALKYYRAGDYAMALREINQSLSLRPSSVNEQLKQSIEKKLRGESSPPATADTPLSKPEGGTMGQGQRAGQKKTLTIKGIDYTFCWCPAGTFTMGSPETEEGRSDQETPHEVTLSRGFWLLESEVTQAMWESVMGNNPSKFKGAKLPVEQVSWTDCQEFITRLNAESSELQMRLPSEAEWEYACRAGTSSPYSFGGELNGDKANCNGNDPYGTTEKGKYLKQTREVKSYSPNAWGLYDMHGNVWEWCQDWYDKEYYKESPTTDPTGPESGSSRVYRGGGWGSIAWGCRSACRYGDDPGYRPSFLGFRLALSSASSS
ncbi:MAG: SUMF1/EgtB/PvdO family nonheme iron enzyme, partial [Thermoguttaceae bacterium]|nr:SUMF1/EgtB/PvdO family nonheme iron enzyme [Thermoguttaceae bacterium]